MTEISNLEDRLAERCAAAMYARDEASRSLGIEIQQVKAGYAELTMKVATWMLNGASVCHGGLIFALADTAMAFASNSRNENMRLAEAKFVRLCCFDGIVEQGRDCDEISRRGTTTLDQFLAGCCC